MRVRESGGSGGSSGGVPGRQAERTTLSWRRSAATYVGVGALILHSSRGEGGVRLVAGVVAILSGAAVFLIAQLRARQLRRRGPDGDPMLAPPIAYAAGVTALTIALGLAVLIT